MPSLKSDIVGHVARLPLKPSEANSLLPLYEAVSNSLHALTERYGDKGATSKGRIEIEVLRDDTQGKIFPVCGFVVRDNGAGFNDTNYTSFLTPFSQLKMARGGKGIGRLGWLKVFEHIHVESHYETKEGLKVRDFDFLLTEKEQIAIRKEGAAESGEVGTTLTLSGYQSSYGSYCPDKVTTIIQRLIGHFLPVFAGDKAPSIILIDGVKYDLKKEFKDKVHDSQEVMVEAEVEGEIAPFILKHMRCEKGIRPRGKANNWLCFCAHERGVKEYGIDGQIGLKTLSNDEIYIGAVTGDFLDKNVNQQRTDFTFDYDAGEELRRRLGASIREYLAKEVAEALAHKKSVALSVIRKNPQYLYLQEDLDEFVTDLKPSSTSEEEIYLEMSQNKFRRQRNFSRIKQEIVTSDQLTESVTEKIEEYKKYIAADQKGALADYVIKRKAILDLLNHLRGFAEPEKENHHLEEAVHSLICPMRVDSHQLSIEDHNLWILDDRLAFFNFFASDKPISSYTDSESMREPDMALFYDSCVAWRESDKACDTVILVEFKRPGKETYTDKTDPFMQLMDYVTLFKSGKTVRDRKGAVISGIGPNTSFQCYIVADLTESLTKRLRGILQSTPDARGLFGYTSNPAAYVEVVPYGKLLDDAQARNAIFFEKLGLAN